MSQPIIEIVSEPISRRTLLKGGVYGAAGLALSGQLALSGPLAQAAARAKKAKAGKAPKAKAVIQIWMWGGPTHLDTFDPKPEAGNDYTGPLKSFAETNVKGIRIGESLPLLAKQADKYSILRSMTHGNNGHETASYMVQTGRKPGGRDVFPMVGAVTSLYKGYDAGYKGLIPPYVVLTKPQGRFSEAGFLGTKYKPFATGGNPGAREFLVEGVAAPGITRARQKARQKLLTDLDPLRAAMANDPNVRDLKDAEAKAYELILGDAGKLFDLSTEKDELRDRYGKNTFGQSCLMARRLVEAGVPYITINYQGWDTHKQHFEAMRRKLPQMDQGFATLLDDLSQRGLLDSTIVWWGGEFGRTPKVQTASPWNGGRSHYGKVFSSVVAGGGFKGGHVIGESDARGETVKDRPIYPWDMTASIYQLLGIDPNAKLPHPQGKDLRVVAGKDQGYVSGGLLKEIM